MTLGSEKYIRLTTFRRNGTPVPSPVWVVPLDGGEIGFWTSSGSGKAKRVAHTSRVLVQASDGRGRPKPGSDEIEATARTVATGPEMDEIRRKIKAKYGVMVPVSKFFNTIGGTLKRKRIPYGDCGIVITMPS